MTDAERRATYLQLVREGKGEVTCARAVDMTVGAMRAYISADVGFAQDIEHARAELLEQAEEVAYKKALAGDFNALKMVLESHLPDKWTKPTDTLNLNVNSGEDIDVAALHAKLAAIDQRKEVGSGEEDRPAEGSE